MEKIAFGKKILKILVVILGAFVFFIGILSVCAVMMNWEFRAWFTDILVTIAGFIAAGFAAGIVYLIGAYTMGPEKQAAVKTAGIVLIIGVIMGSMLFSVIGFFYYAFTRREERTAYIEGQKYVVRSEGIEYIGKDWHPDRFIMIWFPDRESIDRCFSSEKYRKIMSKRENTVDSQAIIVTAGERYGDNSDKRERRMR